MSPQVRRCAWGARAVACALFEEGGMGIRRRAVAAALWAWAGAAFGSPATDAMGLDAAFVQRAMAEFRAMGFAVDARPVDMDDPNSARLFPAGAATAGSAMFSMVDPAGPVPRCAVAVRPSRVAGSQEGLFAVEVGRLGGGYKEAWRAMFRHELGHCALAALAPRSAADPLLSEPFADVFSMQWGSMEGGEAAALPGPFAQARMRMGQGAHATGAALERWSKGPAVARRLSPCEAAWVASPMDGRAPSMAGPAAR